jgi:putative tryptophan/tyrosine transport system substrate-binding protein
VKASTGQSRIIVLAFTAILFIFSISAEAQQAGKIPRIGIASSGTASNPGPTVKVLQQGLRELGYVEGNNILLEYRFYEGVSERSPALIAELVKLNVDVLFSVQTQGIRAAKQATKTIPIVMVTTVDPVTTGLVDSLAWPGGNITGLTLLTRDLNGKRLELLKELVPKVSRVGLLTTDSVDGRIRLKEYEAAARLLTISLQSLEIRTQNPDFEGAFQTAIKGHANGIITRRSGLLIGHRKRIADLAIKHRLPSMSERDDMVEAGVLASYSANETEAVRRAAVYVDKILKGAKPADLPIEQPTKFELVINLKTAKQIGLTIPPNVLARADKVIK